MDLTVVICTYNRAENLPKCIQALASQAEDVERVWEVLIVDNNSSDNTKGIVEQLIQQHSITIRYAFEAQQGLNYARNTGLQEAKGKYIAYIDDDIIVAPTWLAALFDAFETYDADSVGGRILLDPSLQLPAWIRPDTDMLGFLGHQDFGNDHQLLDGRSSYPFGGNMAFNRRVIDRIGYFDPKLGRKGEGRTRSELFKGAETDYFHRLAESGSPVIVYAPKATVYHQVKPFQLRKRYFRTIHFNAGYQRALYDRSHFPIRILNIPRFYYLQIMRAAGKYLVQLVTRGPDWSFRQQMNVAHMTGTMLGYWQQDRTNNREQAH